MNEDKKPTPLEGLATLCSILRKSGEFDRVLRMTESAVKSIGVEKDKSGLARVLASRGGAFRDFLRPIDAIEMGMASVALNPEPFHAYRLLGAAHYDLGRYEKGDRYFQEAIRRGADATDINRVKALVKRAQAEDKKLIIKFADEEAEDRMYFDLDELKESGLVRHELDDIAEGFHRSADDGWYYES